MGPVQQCAYGHQSIIVRVTRILYARGSNSGIIGLWCYRVTVTGNPRCPSVRGMPAPYGRDEFVWTPSHSVQLRVG